MSTRFERKVVQRKLARWAKQLEREYARRRERERAHRAGMVLGNEEVPAEAARLINALEERLTWLLTETP